MVSILEEIYASPPSMHPGEEGGPGYAKTDYLPVPQDNPDLDVDVLPPPYSGYPHHQPALHHHPPAPNGYYAHFASAGPPSTSTFAPHNDRLVHVTYVDDRQLIEYGPSPPPLLSPSLPFLSP